MASLITSAVTCTVTSVTWCFCSACTSLLTACCGNDKPSSGPPSVTSGRKRSVFLLVLAIGIALGFQYGVAPKIVDSPQISFNYIRDAWIQGCDQLATVELQKTCAGNNGAYRALGAATLFYLLAAIAAALKPTANREAWPAKYILFLLGVLATCFIPNDPLFSAIYLNIARIGGILFIFIQQVVIIDVAHNWNESWVEKSNVCESEEVGSGKKWLFAILFSCAVLFGLALAGLIYMFIAFTGCPTNNTFISLTLVFCVVITAAQLSGEEGSLLASSCVSAWAVYLAYGAVTKNLDNTCNPTLGEPTPSTIVLGLFITILSLGWTGWSYTAEDKLQVRPKDDGDEEEDAAANYTQQTEASESMKKVTGVVTGYGTNDKNDADQQDGDQQGEDTAAAPSTSEEEGGDETNNDPSQLSNSWRLNIALAAVACWTAMILTHWGAVQTRGSIANPSASNVAMWIVIASQWLALLLYLWTIVAPSLFPDRDFS